MKNDVPHYRSFMIALIAVRNTSQKQVYTSIKNMSVVKNHNLNVFIAHIRQNKKEI